MDTLWGSFNIFTREHFYHVGGSENNRNPMIEAIITNYSPDTHKHSNEKTLEQLMLLETKGAYDT